MYDSFDGYSNIRKLPPYTRVSKETLDTLQHLEALAQSGRCQGLAVVAILTTGEHILHATRLARQQPEFTVGCLTHLAHQLMTAADTRSE